MGIPRTCDGESVRRKGPNDFRHYFRSANMSPQAKALVVRDALGECVHIPHMVQTSCRGVFYMFGGARHKISKTPLK